jgi:hypothetical protein
LLALPAPGNAKSWNRYETSKLEKLKNGSFSFKNNSCSPIFGQLDEYFRLYAD